LINVRAKFGYYEVKQRFVLFAGGALLEKI